MTREKAEPASPQLAAHFAEEEADSQQAERRGGAQNAGPVVMQVPPQPTCKSLGVTQTTCSATAAHVILDPSSIYPDEGK